MPFHHINLNLDIKWLEIQDDGDRLFNVYFSSVRKKQGLDYIIVLMCWWDLNFSFMAR